MPPSPLSLPAVPWLTVGRFWPHPGWGWIEDHGEEWSVLRIEMVLWDQKFSCGRIQISFNWGWMENHGKESTWTAEAFFFFYIKRHLEKQAAILFYLSSYLGKRNLSCLLKRNVVQALSFPSGSTYSPPKRGKWNKGSVAFSTWGRHAAEYHSMHYASFSPAVTSQLLL